MSTDEISQALSDGISLEDLIGITVALEAAPPILRGRCPFHPDFSRSEMAP